MTSTLERIAPGFIVAAPTLEDPNFDHTVVLMCAHGEDGAMGLVINRPAPVSLFDLYKQMEIDCQVDEMNSRSVLIGGPVALDSGLLLYEATEGDELRSDEMKVTETLRICPNADLLKQIGAGQGPERFHVFLGHAGWAAGQLEQEIAQGGWIPASLRADIIFGMPMEERWESTLEAEGLPPGLVGSFRPTN